MKSFIGTNMVLAQPMRRGEYNLYRGWAMPADENPDDEGFLVEYVDGGKPNHPAHFGYISWSPKDVFDRAYRSSTGLDFGVALQALKAGHRVAREGWYGQGMWLALSGPLGGRRIPAGMFWSQRNAEYAAQTMDGQANVLPCITLKTAAGDIQMGWLASQADMLAEDWFVIEAAPDGLMNG